MTQGLASDEAETVGAKVVGLSAVGKDDVVICDALQEAVLVCPLGVDPPLMLIYTHMFHYK